MEISKDYEGSLCREACDVVKRTEMTGYQETITTQHCHRAATFTYRIILQPPLGGAITLLGYIVKFYL